MTDVERMKFLEARKNEVSAQLTGVHAKIASLGAQAPMTLRQEAHDLVTTLRGLKNELRPLSRAIHLQAAASAGPEALVTQAMNMVAAAQEQLATVKDDSAKKVDELHKRLEKEHRDTQALKLSLLAAREEKESLQARIGALEAALEAGRERRAPLLDVARLLVMAEQNEEVTDALYDAMIEKAVAIGRQQLSLERIHGQALLAAGVVPRVTGVET